MCVGAPFTYRCAVAFGSGFLTGSVLVLGGRFIFGVLNTPQLFNRVRFNRENAVADSCSICHQFFKPDEHLAGLSCTHLYHSWCINRWFRESRTCPLCRRWIFNLSKMDVFLICLYKKLWLIN